MGIAWCRDRVEQAHNSKSPVDRILVRCSNAIKPKTSYSHSQGKIANDFVYRGMRSKNLVPIHALPPRTRHRPVKATDWQTCNLTVTVAGDSTKTPIPPPRKKKKRKMSSMEVLNCPFPKLNSPGYVIYSENLLNKTFSDVNESEGNGPDVARPPDGKSCGGEETSRSDCFVKLSGNRMKKIKTESYPNDAKEENVKNDNEKKTEQKIKHVSTVSLPNYNELIKPRRKDSADVGNGDDKNGNQSAGLKHPRRNSSTLSLPGEGSNSILASLSEATIHRLETYMKRCRSFGSLKPQQLLEKLQEFNKAHTSASESSDSWSGLDEWDLAVIEFCDPRVNASPLVPKSRLTSKQQRSAVPIARRNEKIFDGISEKGEITSVETLPAREREGNMVDWFIDPEQSLPTKTSSTPPPSPEADPCKDPTDDTSSSQPPPDDPRTHSVTEHSSLLDILDRYKNENTETEKRFKGDSQKDEMNFDEVDVEYSSKQNLNPFVSTTNRSNSLTEEERVTFRAKLFKLRSPSEDAEISPRDKETMNREISLKSNCAVTADGRGNLCRSLPDQSFHAIADRRTPSLRKSLDLFLGFADSEKPTPQIHKNSVKSPQKEDSTQRKPNVKENGGNPPPRPLAPTSSPTPPTIVINSHSEREENTKTPDNLVTSNDDVALM